MSEVSEVSEVNYNESKSLVWPAMRAAYRVILVTVLEESALFCFFALWPRVTGTVTDIACWGRKTSHKCFVFRASKVFFTHNHTRILHLSKNGEPLRIIALSKSRI